MATHESKPETLFFRRAFIYTAGGILLLTGLAKIWSAFGQARLLDYADPITGIHFRYLMGSVGIVEMVIANICLFSAGTWLPMLLVAWLATGFLAYRAGLALLGWQSPCHCLGNLTDALHIPPRIADNGLKIILGYLLLGSYFFLVRAWQLKQKRQPAA